MKKNDKADIFSRSLTELRKTLSDTRSEVNQLVLDNKQFKLKDNRSIFHKKKHMARILTAIKEKELEQAAPKVK